MSITKATVKTRLNYWNVHKPPNGYSQSTYSKGADGRDYRNDCSGYISMLSSLTGSPNTNAQTSSTITKRISKDELTFGDLVLVGGVNGKSGHVLMFDHWTDPGKSRYFAHDFGSGAEPKHREVRYPYNDDKRAFQPYRLLTIVQDKPSAPKPDKPAEPAKIDYEDYRSLQAGRRNIRLGSAGDDVRNAQSVLNHWYKAQIDDDGFFGPKTDERVRQFQKRAKLDADGIIGRKTWSALGFPVRF